MSPRPKDGGTQRSVSDDPSQHEHPASMSTDAPVLSRRPKDGGDAEERQRRPRGQHETHPRFGSPPYQIHRRERLLMLHDEGQRPPSQRIGRNMSHLGFTVDG